MTSHYSVAKKESVTWWKKQLADPSLCREPPLAERNPETQIEGYGAISTKPATPLLDTVNVPAHLKSLDMDQLKQVAKELRADLIYNVSQTGGHLGSSLGVIELTVALNYVFDQP